jgi:hypothetical protein
MSSWGVLLALAGISYSGPEMRMGFDPKMNADDFRTVWTAGSGWGTYSQKLAGKALSATLETRAGTIELRELDLTIPPGAGAAAVRSVKPALGGASAAAQVRREGSTIRVIWPNPVRVEPGKALTLAVQF